MAEIGTLEYVISTRDETSSTIDVIAAKIQGMSQALADVGSLTDEQVQRMAQDIQNAYAGLDTASDQHKAALASLQQTYTDLGTAMGAAFQQGTREGDIAYRQAQSQRQQVAAQIREEKKLLATIGRTADELQEVEKAYEKKAAAVKKTTDAQSSMRRQMMQIVQQMAEQEEAAFAAGGATAVSALRASEAYQALQKEAGRLSNAIGDARTQMSIFANDNAGIQGVIVGLQGMTGAISAAQGILGMFTKDQDELQKVMLKVQSVMAIANGVMQVSNALNKDSYFTIVILNRIKQAWVSTSKEAVAAQQAEIAATQSDTAATAGNTAGTALNTAAEAANNATKKKGIAGIIAAIALWHKETTSKLANTLATKAASTANKGLALSFRLLSAAIKSVPVIGWILAGVGAIAGVAAALTRSSREAKKEQEELNDKIKETAAEPVASISKLSAQYTALGNNMKEKEKFIESNKGEFEKLGLSINSVADAEEVLIKNKEKFIKAQIEKAVAASYYDKAKEKAKELVEAEQDYAKKQSNKRREAVEEIEQEMQEVYGQAMQHDQQAQQLMGRFATQAATTSSTTAKKTAEGAAESIASLNRLSKQWESLGGDIKKQDRFIAENKAEFDRLGLGIKDASDAENAFVANKQQFIDAMTAKAESMAYFDLAKDKFKEYIEASLEMDSLMEGVNAGAMSDEIHQRINTLQTKMSNAKREADNLITKGNRRAEDASKTIKPTSSNTASKDDPFIKELNERKKAYERYSKFVHSTNATLQAAAQGDEFKKLLEGGATYKEYLQAQISEMEAAGGKTKEYRDHLAALYDELAALEKATVIDDFKKALEEQLKTAQTQQEMLDLIAAQRKQLEEGSDTEVNQEKSKILDEQAKSIADKDAEQTKQLLLQYSDYLGKKVAFEATYAENSRRLNKAIAEAKTEDERRVAENALAQLERQRQRYATTQQTGDTDYDALLVEFRTFEDKKAQLELEYEEKIAIARQHGNEEMVKQLQRQQGQAISQLAVEKIKDGDAFKGLFENIDSLTLEAVDNLIAGINQQTLDLSAEIDPKDLEKIKNELQEARDKIAEKQPFTALQNAIEKYASEGSDANLQNLMDAASVVGGEFKGVADNLKDIASTMGNELLEKCAEIAESALGAAEGIAQVAAGAATGDVMSIINGAVQLLGEVVKWLDFTPQQFKNFDKIIEENEKKMEEYGEAYNDLQREVSKATGQALDETNKKLAENLRLQIMQLQTSIQTMEKELADVHGSGKEDTKKQYQEEIDAAKKDLKDVQNQLADLMDSIVERTLGSRTIASIMEDLATALVDAWAEGENAAEAYSEKVKEIVKDIARNMVIQNIITDEFTNMLSKYTDQWTEDTEWENKFADIQAWYTEAMNYSGAMMDALNGMSDEMKEWLTMDTEASGLSGAIKGMSQESADLLAGQTNAMRLNQAAQIELLREQLIQLQGLNNKAITANRWLASIDARMREANHSGNITLRSLGQQNTAITPTATSL